MAPKSVTEDWDILVSYAAGDDLNNLLKDAWSGPLGAKEIDYTDDHLGYKVTMHKPQLQFSTTDIKATLKIELEGTFWSNDWGDDDEGQTYKFEDFGYSLSITAPIKAIDGNQTLHDAKSSIVFEDKTDASVYHIILHMQNENLEWKSIDPPASVDKAGKTLAKRAIRKIEKDIRSPHNTRFLDIKLGEVNNIPNDKSVKAVADLFRPKAFQMSTREGALDIFIQTVGGYQEGKNGPVFAVTDTPFDTKDYNGAIIISHRLFQDKYLVPQIQEHCKTLAKGDDKKGKVTANKVDSGFQLELVFDKVKAIASGGYSSGFFSDDNARSIDLNFSSHPVKLNIINNKDSMPQASWEWEHSFEVWWRSTIHGGFDVADRVVDDSSTIKAKIGDNRSDIATLNDNKLDFEFQFKDENQPKMTIPDSTTSKYKDLKVKLDKFKFGLDELQYFASTNVFAPGLHFIDLKTVRAPHDVFVMGKMKSK
ncbi:hypothetical protein ASPWEDRAFT_169944 [Aspergillus wentii DTO 134E9]|uniref:Uncharacterized protein n=1 Tax=Aspergillus wentii DTO 134E9 TaxID=1073089 RepID=A0A1L9RND8_ASPWE|nr:uncharacterized protein ASPWEDRAFT_169944 [Aspergillus wentii DTO 134E9]OJJ36422.1 hypothetical protein ASPWEDRAFT_169944 [Aspergillus wentii DTO 134E9]